MIRVLTLALALGAASASGCGVGEVETWHQRRSAAAGVRKAASPSLWRMCVSPAQRRLSAVPQCGAGSFAVLAPVGTLGHTHYVCREGRAPAAQSTTTTAPPLPAWSKCRPGFCDKLLPQFHPRLVWGCRPCTALRAHGAAPAEAPSAAAAPKRTTRVVGPKITCRSGYFARQAMVRSGAHRLARIGWVCSRRKPRVTKAAARKAAAARAHVPCPDGWVQHPTARGRPLVGTVLFGYTSSGTVCVPFSPGRHHTCPPGYRKFIKAKQEGNHRRIVTFCREAVAP